MLKRAPQNLLRKGLNSNRLCLRQFAIKTQVVPNMGDSITEGTVVEWSKKVGEAVNADDIVALIESAKIVVEVRAETAGVITEHHVNIEDDVEVGAKLFTLDTEGTASFASEPIAAKPKEASPSPPASSPPPPKPASSPPVATAASSHGRTPMIEFRYGKRDPPKRAATAASSIHPDFMGTDDYFSVPLPSRFERKIFSEEEIDATLSGGAFLVDNGLTQSISKRLEL